MQFELSASGDLLVWDDSRIILKTKGNPIAANAPFASLEEAINYYNNVLNWKPEPVEEVPLEADPSATDTTTSEADPSLASTSTESGV